MLDVSGVILNWKRPANVTRILSGWQASGVVTEGIVLEQPSGYDV